MRNLLRSNRDVATDTTRLEAFSDGVIAIAITLLILEIHVPQLADAAPADLWRSLAGLWPNYLGYVISFATIGIMWVNHHLIFRLIDRTDYYLTLANLLLLFCIAAIPFTTAVMADYLGHPAQSAGVLVYSGWFFLTALAYNLLWRVAATGNRLLATDADPTAVRAVWSRFRLGPPSYGVAFLLAFVSPIASLLVLLALAVLYILPYRPSTR